MFAEVPDPSSGQVAAGGADQQEQPVYLSGADVEIQPVGQYSLPAVTA
jgi:hypothetical protein